MIPALKRQKEYCKLFQGSPIPSLKPATYTSNLPPPKKQTKNTRGKKEDCAKVLG